MPGGFEVTGKPHGGVGGDRVLPLFRNEENEALRSWCRARQNMEGRRRAVFELLFARCVCRARGGWQRAGQGEGQRDGLVALVVVAGESCPGGQPGWPPARALRAVLVAARSDLDFLAAGGVQKSPAEGGDVPDGLSTRAVPSDALRDGCLHARDRHAG